MRNKRETDISGYTDRTVDTSMITDKNDSGVKRFFKGIAKFLLTTFSICFVAMIIAGISLAIYIFTIASEPTGINLKAKSLNQTSFIYIEDKSGEFKEYQTLYSTENRIWVDNQDIPQAMKDAVVAIEDKRFYDHNGVDWTRTFSAVINLATGQDTYGGSTITQQLIKNITDDNEVSINRKIREICKALNLEKEYTKDQILEAYLNVVNFGNNCQGVEAAAQLYFDKSIKECSIAECAAIAGITQNPAALNPLVYPEDNKKRRETILYEMYSQEKITKEEYDAAKEESESMTFVGWKNNDSDDDDDDYVQNWYIDQMFYDLREDLALYYNISEDAAADKLYTEGLKIYCAMDEEMQNYIEKAALDIDKTYDYDLQIGSVLMDFDGRVIATVGSSNRKTQALQWDRASHSSLQPGSSIKPVLVYPIAIENKQIYFSSLLKDEQLPNYKYVDGAFVAGPNNAYGTYNGDMMLADAIEWSSNCTAVQTMELIGGPSVAYEQAVTKMGFKKLTEEDGQITGSLSIGGTNGGVSVKEMAASYTYLGNGGLYYEPYTYYYVTDSEGNIIIDNRDAVPKQAYSAETASIMNRLLSYNVTYSAHTNAAYARISGWDIIGKTGTTDDDKDSWFCGASPYATMATWCGFDQPETISSYGRTLSAKFFSQVMGKYLEGKEQKDYVISPNLIKAQYNPYTGLIVSTESLSGKYIGYYTEDNMPAFGGYYDPDANDNSDESGNDNSGDYSDEYATSPDASNSVDDVSSPEDEESSGTDENPPDADGGSDNSPDGNENSGDVSSAV